MHSYERKDKMTNATKKITEGAMMCALVGLLLFFNRQFGNVLEYAFYWILAFPILIYTVRYGWKAALVPAASMLLMSLMISAPTTSFYLASSLICGLGYGYGVYRHWKRSYLLTFTAALTLISYFITMVLFASAFGYDLQEDILVAKQLSDYISFGNIDILQLAVILSVIVSIVTAILQTICIHLFACLLLRRIKYDEMPVKSIFDCMMPKWVAYISICIWLLFSFKNMLKLEGNLSVAVISAYIVVCIVLCAECVLDILGITVIYQKRLLGILLSLLCIAGLIFMPTRLLIIGCGIISILSALRLKWKRGVIHGTLGKS